ncbi:ARF GTPase-activating protein GIT1 isoform X3 [Haemaphysalis longicornis]
MIGRLAERTCRPAVQTSAVTVVCVVPCHEGSYVWLLKFVETAALPMVHSLHASGANAIWEHQLLEPGQGGRARRKPSARDSLHPVKSEFIRAKHQNLAFVHRAAKEGEQPSQEDLSKQLHASVRTANLETSLRLLAQGALPSQLHPEKGSTALHVAARGGQACQVELLLVYGADPTVHDARGHTPADAAREAGHADLEARLVESQYEVTDRLAWHLSGRSPEHQLGQHFILPEMADCLELSARAAKQKLQSLGERLFGELARDLYDEVDRRECEATWMGASTLVGADRQAVPFLPVSPELSSTRNQARQKLARLTARELATLLIDILCEAKRRHLGAPPAAAGCREQRLSDDEPLYDSVASDEDSHALGPCSAAPGRSPCASGATLGGAPKPAVTHGPCLLPSYQEVLAQTEKITRAIQDLLASAQEGNQDAFLPCSRSILQAVLCMSALFGSSRPPGGALGECLWRLTASAHQLQLWAASGLGGCQLIQGAYEVAKGAKLLVQAYPPPC